MRFYRLECTTEVDQETDGSLMENRKKHMRTCMLLRTKSEEYNWKHKKINFYFAEWEDSAVIVGAVTKGDTEITQVFKKFSEEVGINIELIDADEITFGNFMDLLEYGRRHNFVSDIDDVLTRNELEQICRRGFGSVEYGENIAEDITRKELEEIAYKYIATKSMDPEIRRIYTENKNKRFYGHPVHYMVQTDDHDTRNDIYKGIIGALAANDRLESKRYSYINMGAGKEIDSGTVEALYKCSSGGSVVIRYVGGDVMEDDRASEIRESIETVSHFLRKYRNEVLTIICLPRENTKLKGLFFDFLGNVSIVELKEELADSNRAKEYLKFLAKKNHIRNDKALTEKIVDEQTYLTNDLRNIFDSWYDHKLKNSLYPQYSECASVRKETVKKIAIGSGYDTLREMIGLSEAKEVIQKALNYYKVQGLYRDNGIDFGRPAMHMVFTGNPGTAKTTVARIFAKILKENGVLSKGRLIEVGRGDLVGKYVGWTAPTIQRKFKEAKGSVLFIDEAYSLVDDRDGSYGDEAINTIVQEMENHRDDVIVIFAGYPDKMEAFLNKNPGLRSRIAFHVPFKDYDTDELCQIAKLMGKSNGTRFTEDALDKMSAIFDEARTRLDFGNGRFVRNLLEMARMNQAGRILNTDVESITKDDICTICAEDIEAPNIGEVTKTKIGFCA